MPWLPLEWDVNHDGATTISDIGLWIQHVFFLPGDWLIWFALRYFPSLPQFLEVDSGEYGSTFSALISVFAWLAFAIFVLITSHWLAAIDQSITRLVKAVGSTIAIKLRIAKRLMSEAMQRRRSHGMKTARGAGNPKLNAAEMRVLKAHAYAKPHSTLALSDVVRATGVPRAQVAEILNRLHELDLLDSREGEAENEQGYLLTEPGRRIVTFDRLSVGKA